METPLTCPDRGELERLVLGTVSDAEAEELEAHLSGCARCLETIQGVKGNDTLVEALRNGEAAVEAIRQVSDAGLVERLSRLCPSWDESPTKTTHDVLALLAPAQGPDEIGRLGEYRVQELLGVGGMGVVFRGEDLRLNRPVALKVMQPTLARDPSARQRFRREAHAMAVVKHDHVATIYQVSEEQDVPFLVMELLHGECLENRLGREGRLPLAELVRVGREAASGLAAAHAGGVIHRDIKPGNIWLEGPSQPPRVKILDFGLARASGKNLTLTQDGALLGTPAYMSPEQAQGQAFDARCDLFSLGCVLYRAATGEMAFRGDNVFQLLQAIIHDAPRPVRECNPDVPYPLADLIGKLLAKRPENRFASARDVEQALRAIGENPPQPKPKGSARRLSGLIIAAAAVMLAVLGPLLYLYGPTIIRIATNKGELVLEVDDRDLEVTVNREGESPRVLLLDRHNKRELILQPGDYLIQVKTKDGLEFATRKLTLNRGDRRIVGAELVLAEGKPKPALKLPEALAVERVIGDGRWSHFGWVWAVAVSPDGKDVASISSDGTARVWDAATGRQRLLLEGHTDQILCVAFHPEGKLLATGGRDKVVKLWDLDGGKESRTLSLPHHVHTVAFSPDGRFVAGMSRPLLKVWQTTSGKEVQAIELKPDGLENVTSGFAFSPDGKRLAYRAGAEGVKIVDTLSGKESVGFPADDSEVACVAYSPDGKILAVGSQSPKPGVILWDVETGKKLKTIRHSVADEGVLGLTFTPDGKTLVAIFCLRDFPTYRFHGRARQWDVATGKEGAAIIPPVATAGVWGMACSLDGNTLYTVSGDVTVRRWNLVKGQELEPPGGTVGHLLAMAISPDGQTIAGGGFDPRITLFDAASGEERRSFRLPEGVVEDLAFSPEGSMLACCTKGQALRLWDLNEETERYVWRHPAADVAFRPDGKVLATRSWGNKALRLWDVATRQEWKKTDAKGLGPSTCMAFSPDGTTLAAGCTGYPVVRWDLVRGGEPEPLPAVEDNDSATDLAFSPDGKTLAVAHKGKDFGRAPVWLYDAATGRTLHPLAETYHHVMTLAFSPDSQVLATGGVHDGTVRLWEAQTGLLLAALSVGPRHGHIHRVRFVSNDRLAVLNGNGTILLLGLK